MNRARLVHSDPVSDRHGVTVGVLRRFDDRTETSFAFIPNLAGLQRGYNHRESINFDSLWSKLTTPFYNGHHNWNAGRSGRNH